MAADRVPQPGDRWRGRYLSVASDGVVVLDLGVGVVRFRYRRSGAENQLPLRQFLGAYVFVSAADPEAVAS